MEPVVIVWWGTGDGKWAEEYLGFSVYGGNGEEGHVVIRKPEVRLRDVEIEKLLEEARSWAHRKSAGLQISLSAVHLLTARGLDHLIDLED